ncbi:MAG: flagellar assembly protein FliW [Defluviitaleaceae bacterium]|nr:flagellar assembly protein FliW [Defluviitaleaceae bacterium]MCL2273335.1 flagellar assembly protein FliW [Defluviitaleaceae bacterium]
MEIIFTQNFGELSYNPGDALDFPVGLPGYPDDRRFLLIGMEDTRETFYWLQSLDDGDVCFPMMDVYKALPDYDPHVDPDELADLGEIEGTSLEVYNIAVIPDDIAQTRVNLRAPVIINRATQKGKQIICANEDYPVRYYVMDDLKAAGTFQPQEAASC